ncbi:MAG: hypothetical protein ACE5KM_09570 [Planctomycetaceae bacterium]
MKRSMACECRQPGWCERHQCYKTEHWHRLCQTRQGYFQLWEAGRGPGQNTKRNPAAEFPCRHQGEHLRVQQCRSCAGSVRLKVFACPLHDECTIGKTISGIACCTLCDDYERNTEPAAV